MPALERRGEKMYVVRDPMFRYSFGIRSEIRRCEYTVFIRGPRRGVGSNHTAGVCRASRENYMRQGRAVRTGRRQHRRPFSKNNMLGVAAEGLRETPPSPGALTEEISVFPHKLLSFFDQASDLVHKTGIRYYFALIYEHRIYSQNHYNHYRDRTKELHGV